MAEKIIFAVNKKVVVDNEKETIGSGHPVHAGAEKSSNAGFCFIP